MNHLLHIHIVTHAGNARLAPYALEAARRAWPFAPVTILDDAHAPIPPAIQTNLALRPGVTYRRTRWQRGGNLRGIPCLRGLLREYRRSVRAGAAYVIKLDPDTLILNRAPLLDMMADGIDYGTHTTLDSPWGGGCILMSARAVTLLERAVRWTFARPGVREDITQGALATSLGLRVRCLDGNTPATDKPVFYTGIDTGRHADRHYISRMARLVSVASVGTSHITGAQHITEALTAKALLETK